MPSTYTDLLRLEDQATGENEGTWGDKLDTNFDMVEEAIAGAVSISTTGGNTTLSTNNAATDQARPMILQVDGTLTSDATLICPATTKIYVVENGTTGAFDVKIKASGGSNEITTEQGFSGWVYCSGTEVYKIAPEVSRTNDTVPAGATPYVRHDTSQSLSASQKRQALDNIDAMPVGSVIWRAIKTTPTGYLSCDGSAVSRTTYSTLWNAVKIEDSTVDTTSGSAIVTMDDTSDLEAAYYIEGPGIPAGTIISSVDSGTQITISQNATATASNITATFIPTPFGQGDGSTTFTLPDLRGEFIRGWDNGRGVDSGRSMGTNQSDAFRSHVHRQQGFQAGSSTTQMAYHVAQGVLSALGNTEATGGAETRPRNVSMAAFVKY